MLATTQYSSGTTLLLGANLNRTFSPSVILLHAGTKLLNLKTVSLT